MFNLIIFGPPGSGKGTQSVKVAEKYGLKHISTGDILRCEVKNKTELGNKVKGIMNTGDLVSDELLFQILYSIFENNKDIKGFIFDGFPRTIAQAHELNRRLTIRKSEVVKVISLQVDDNAVVNRLLKRAKIQGRKDDNESTIGNRLNIYKLQTSPLLEYYNGRGVLTHFDGEGSIDNVFDDICKSVDIEELAYSNK
jgi:adenylate kinase